VSALAFFVGKGGVGKTTLSSACAAEAALRRKRERVLLLSTDPAHSLADVFQVKLGDRPRRVALRGAQLWLWQVNADKQFRKFLAGNRDAILELVESGTIFSRAEIEPLLDTTLPGMAEMAALLAIHGLLESGRYDRIVVDTAPIGHTLRLFEMPEHFAKFLDFLDVAAGRDAVLAAHFGGRVTTVSQPFIQEWRRMVEGVRAALASEDTQITLVTTSETFALNESIRVAEQMRTGDAPMEITDIVLNRLVNDNQKCAACHRRFAVQFDAQKFIGRNFPGIVLRTAPDPGHPFLGAAQLAALGKRVFGHAALRVRGVKPRLAKVKLSRSTWPLLDVPLTLTLGKGGVGKTTVSAALAFHARAEHPKAGVTICSTDPAPSLDDVFEKKVGDKPVSVLDDKQLHAMEFDAVGDFRIWAQRMKRKLDDALGTEVQGVHIDLTLDREIFAALLDIVPPGVDELFAIFRILDLLDAGRDRVVIDMAPTGHALELLRMPDRMLLWSRLLLKSLAPHRTLPLAREIAVEVATIGQRVRELAQMLRDRKRTRLWVVLLAEPLPDRETRRLLADLDELGVASGGLFVNRVIFKDDAAGCRRCETARAWQQATLARLAGEGEVFVVREFGQEISGRKALQRFTRELWRIA
jgi:arsenite-transporting ATPase